MTNNKSTTIGVLAQGIMDQYYQDFASVESFFSIDDFIRFCISAYSGLLDKEFKLSRRESKMETGYSAPQINPSFLVYEKKDMQAIDGEFIVQLSNNVFIFPFDNFTYAIQSVKANGKSLQKVSIDELDFVDIVPVTCNVYYSLIGADKIKFTENISTPITVGYVPALSPENPNQIISDALAEDVRKMVLSMAFAAKNGNVVDEVEDYNKNAVIQQQVNPSLNK